MLGDLFFGLLGLVQFVLCVRAIVGSTRERFALGTAGGVFRVLFLVLLAAATLSSALSPVAEPHQRATVGWAGVGALVAVVCGPLVSFGVLIAAYRRTRNVAMAEEERLGRPLELWLPVGVFDALWVAVGVFAIWFSRVD